MRVLCISVHSKKLSTVIVIFQNCSDKRSKQNFKQAVKRTVEQVAVDNRIKGRKLGAGAPTKLDSSDEEFVAKCIEDKATYHGRRHDTVMYTNRYDIE